MQSSGPIHLGGVHVDAALKESADASLVASFHGVGERRSFRCHG
jgi:hypothetical protein